MLARRHALLLGAAAPFLPCPARAEPAPLAERLAGYAHALRYEDLGAETVERVKVQLIDGLGCALAALEERPVRLCRELARGVPGPATLIGGSGARSALEHATFANTAALRFLDFNDTFVGKVAVHPSDSIPACLAVAEAVGATPRQLIAAIALAYEVNCRLAESFDLSRRGWDPTVFALPSVALAAGTLMGLDVGALAQAVNLAINDHIPLAQTRVGRLSDWKGLSVAEANRNAVFAAQLARAGLTGPAPIFEGSAGFARQVGGEAEVDVAGFGGAGRPFRILRCSLKPYPAVIYSQTAIHAAIALAQAVGDPARITALEISTSRRGHQRAGSEPEKWAPTTRETADHSLPWLTARALFDRDLTAASFSAEKLADPTLLAFMRRVTVVEDPAITARTGGEGGAVPTRLTATLADGSRIVRAEEHAPGFFARPMTREEVARKFLGNATVHWPRTRAEAALAALWGLERPATVGAVMRQLG